MRVKNLILISLASLALAALSGCPAGSRTTKSQLAGQPEGPVVSSQPSPGVEESPEVAAEAASESGEAATAVAPSSEELDAIPAPGELDGQWFALYGSGFAGPVKFDYANGHVIDFKADGRADWSVRNNGSVVATVQTRYKVDGATLLLNFSPSKFGETTEFSSSTPLGFGRDQAIGLSAGRDKEVGLSGGRDKEVGLSGGRDHEVGLSAELDEGKDTELKLALLSDGRFLALTDSFNHLMVYGRVNNPGTKLAAGAAGKWQGHMSQHDSFEASFSLQGSQVSATLDNGKGSFSGVLTQGYFVGEINGPQGKELAAILPEDEMNLNGVYTPEPYNELRLHFDFARSASQS